MKIKILKTVELSKYMQTMKIGVDTENYNIPMYEEFTFFSPIDLEASEDTIL